MLSRLLTLFIPINPPANTLEKWREFLECTSECTKAKNSLVIQWHKSLVDFRVKLENKYLEERGKLLNALTKGLPARNTLLAHNRF